MQKIIVKSRVIKSSGFIGILEEENAGKGEGNGVRTGRNALSCFKVSFTHTVEPTIV